MTGPCRPRHLPHLRVHFNNRVKDAVRARALASRDLRRCLGAHRIRRALGLVPQGWVGKRRGAQAALKRFNGGRAQQRVPRLTCGGQWAGQRLGFKEARFTRLRVVQTYAVAVSPLTTTNASENVRLHKGTCCSNAANAIRCMHCMANDNRHQVTNVWI
jgi:hypothetical protein